MKTDALNRHTHLLLMASLGVLLAGCAASRPAPVVHRTPVPEAPPGATAQAQHEDMRPGGAGPLGQSGQPSGQGGGQPSDGSQVTPIYQGAINQPGRYGSADEAGVKVGPQGIKRPYGTPVPPPPAASSVARSHQAAGGNGQPSPQGGAQAAGVAGKAAGAGTAAAQAGAQGAAGGVAQASPVSRGEVSSKPPSDIKTPAAEAKAPAADAKASQAKAPPVPSATRSFDGVRFSWPVGGNVVQGFDGVNNKGLLVAGKVGDPVQAAADGRVIFSGQGPRGYGNLVIIKHSNEMLSVYAHNRSLTVKEGDQVTRGQKIGELGDAGPGRTALHFEVRQSGKPVDPIGVLPKR